MNQPSGNTRPKAAPGQVRRGLSLSFKLVASIIVLLLVGTASISLSIRTLVNNYLTQRTDTQLLQQAELVFKNYQLLERDNAKDDTNSQFITYYVQQYDNQTGMTKVLLQPVYQDGVISRPDLPVSGELGDHQFAKPFTAPAIVSVDKARRVPDHATLATAAAPWRVVALRWVNENGAGDTQYRGIIYIGLSMADQVDMIDTLTRFCAMVSIAVILLGGVISAIAVQRTLSPLKRIEKVAAKIAAGDLSQRVPDADDGGEVGSLARSLNAMLARIERSFHKQQATTEKMKRFVSDASHELRTPLAVIHGYAELYRMQRQSPGALERADDSIAHIEASSERMMLLVEDLLSLTRLDEGHGISITQHVDFGAVIRDSADDLHALDPDRAIATGIIGLDASDPEHPKLETTPGAMPDVVLVADGTRLHQVVTNIVGNIHRYTPADSPVDFSLGVIGVDMDPTLLNQLSPDEASLRRILEAATRFRQTRKGTMVAVARFADHGPGVPEESLTKIFERFYTADPSRARQKGGTGLGMAIVQSVVNAHHGFICAGQTPGGGLTYTIAIPLEQPKESD
ncbi:MAG: ATP-binding protein [Bifidobacterium sp.]|nr:ATP-binding protein [Bifidobacterium sp.]